MRALMLALPADTSASGKQAQLHVFSERGLGKIDAVLVKNLDDLGGGHAVGVSALELSHFVVCKDGRHLLLPCPSVFALPRATVRPSLMPMLKGVSSVAAIE
jgi:hypothetical protein